MDTCEITALDQSNLANGYVTVTCSITIAGSNYTQSFDVYETSPQAISSSVKQQAEIFRSQAESAAALSVAPTATIASLVGTVIDL